MRNGPLISVLLGLTISSLWGQAPSGEDTIRIRVDKTQVGEGQNVVIDAVIKHANGAPVSGRMLHAQVDGKDWGAEYPTLPTGVAHMVVPLPEIGNRSISVTDGAAHSTEVKVQVNPRHFDIVDDPRHVVIMEYETWFGPGYAKWGAEEATPLLGRYSSLDPRVLRQQALWFDEMGFNAVELDWTNNLDAPFPSPAAKECMAATELLLQVYATMPQHPKVLFLMGPENNQWNNQKDVYAGPRFQQQMDYVYDHFINNPAYQGMFVTLEGKPLVLRYLNGPRTGPPPNVGDPRFTTRYVGAWLQRMHADQYGVWSWYDQTATPIYHGGEAEALTVTDGYPSATEGAPAGANVWEMQSAGGKNDGETYRTQWAVAMATEPHFLFINQWNEFIPPDQYNANLSNDMEPTLITEKGDTRASGWSFFYFDLTRDEIAAYRTKIQQGK